MPLYRRTAVLPLPIWCLFFSWLCFGGLDLLEQVNLMPEVEDQDEAALLQLASGLKSEVSSHDDTCDSSLAKVATEPAMGLSLQAVLQFVRLNVHSPPSHSPPSLLLHQQISVYRI